MTDTELNTDVRHPLDATAPRARREGAVLLTGVTGFLGGELLVRHLQHSDRRVFALIRAADEEEARARLRAVLAGVADEPERFEGRVRAVRGPNRASASRTAATSLPRRSTR